MLASFNYTDGADIQGGVVADLSGDFFGTAQGGGAVTDGEVYEIVKTSSGYASTPTVLTSFNGADGNEPNGGLFLDASGDVFGPTFDGGVDGYGTIFEIAKTSSGYASTPTVLVSLNSADGSLPLGGLIADATGDLFGAALEGGAGGSGAIFELASNATLNDTTSVNVSTPAVAPTITGTAANQMLTAGSTDTPFSTVTIGDTNANAGDTLTITLTGAGALADGAGFSASPRPATSIH